MDLMHTTQYGNLPRALKPRTEKTMLHADVPETEHDTGEESGRILVCRACAQPITRPEARTVVNGNHVHIFCNPYGVVFEVACFAFATGLTPEGGTYAEFSWFPGFSWQIVNCARCGEHLGWKFVGRSGGGFHGLLPGKLSEKAED